MSNTEANTILLATICKALSAQINGNRKLANNPKRSAVDRQYFSGGLDAADMVARKIAESGVVDRATFLASCGCVL